MKEYACRKCKALNPEDKVCHNCGETELSDEWSGLIIVLDPKNSNVAKTLSITNAGRYALKVS